MKPGQPALSGMRYSIYTDPPITDGALVRRTRLGCGTVQPDGSMLLELYATPFGGRMIIPEMFEPETEAT